MKFKILFFIYAITVFTIYAQNPNGEILKQSYSTIYKKLRAAKQDSIQQKFHLEAFMRKARNENNWKMIVKGYNNYLHYAPRKQMIVYADSMVYTALDSKDTQLIASAFLTKGLTHYWNKQYIKALDNYILSNKYLLESTPEDPYLQHKLSYNMGLIKCYLGQYDQALSHLKSGLDYFETHNTRAYLVTLHFTGICYRHLGNYILSSKINLQGIEKGKTIGDRSIEVYFRESEAINQYYNRNYQAAIDTLTKVIPTIEKLGDFANVTLGRYYIGKSYWALEKYETAVYYLNLVDQCITENMHINEEMLDTYPMLQNYYKFIGDSIKYHYYLKKQILMGDILRQRQNNLFPRINKDYDQVNIIKKTKQTEKSEGVFLSPESINGFLWILILVTLLMLVILLWYYFKYKYLNKLSKLYSMISGGLNRFNTSTEDVFPELNLSKEDTQGTDLNEREGTKLDISEEKEKYILKGLKSFENKKKYLNKNISLTSLASSLNTNTSYLSHVINQKKGKKFLDYINDLRIEYLIQYAKTINREKRITLRELKSKGGFNSIHILRRSFKLYTGMLPSVFIKELRKDIPKDD